MKIQAGRADINALANRAAQRMAADRDEARQRELSGADKTYAYDTRDQLAVMQTAAPPLASDPLKEPRTRWETLSMPFGLPKLVIEGSVSEATRNGWTLQELLKRRLHRAYRNALEKGRVMDATNAGARAKRADVYIATMEFAR